MKVEQAGDKSLRSRVSTGISGLDDVLGGGLPSGHLYLIEGEPGAGKTTVAPQMGYEDLQLGYRRAE